MVQGMHASFRSFGMGLILSLVLVYLILVAQFRSFVDPLLILLAVPTGIDGRAGDAVSTGTTLNVHVADGRGDDGRDRGLEQHPDRRIHAPLRDEGNAGARGRRDGRAAFGLRPILMTSLATLIGLMPMAMKLGTGSEAYAPLARAIIGGLCVSVVMTVFIVPAAYLLVYRNREAA